MSNSGSGFSSWRKRASSVSSSQADLARTVTNESQTSSQPVAVPPALSSSVASSQAHREPIRSFIHGVSHDNLAPVDSLQNARTVREDTAELANYFLSDGSQRNRALLQRPRSSIHDVFHHEDDADSVPDVRRGSPAIPEVSEPASPDESTEHLGDEDTPGPSVIANLLKRASPPESDTETTPKADRAKSIASETLPAARSSEAVGSPKAWNHISAIEELVSERTPLLSASSDTSYEAEAILEGQERPAKRNWFGKVREQSQEVKFGFIHGVKVATNPTRWNSKAMAQHVLLEPLSCLPAVAVGLLLNILDALSYGMILFPLGTPLFSHLGSAGISIYYVSTIVSQLVFSTGSIFKGAVGSELIEVVPFFHNMAQKILDVVGEDNPDAVIATTIVAYATSSLVTGLVFYLMGKFKFGFMVGFIPRHILIGCIGGVGYFLISTGLEVSARLDGNIKYDLDTFKQLTQPETILLWIFPLVLAVVLFYGQMKGASKYFLPLFILAIPLVFFIFVTAIDALEVDDLRDRGWIFQGPPPGEPWWYFYTLYKFNLVRWDAIIQVIPAMLALTFFGVLHVPINVPALALNTGEDNADLDRELKLHGYSNFLSGCLGSIQNYLVYANTVFVIRSGGNRRLAGYMLAALTFAVMVIGPGMMGYIPVMMVGTLIFDLGFELLLEAVWLPRKKLKLAEYLTVIIIVLVMGTYDFVVGIGVGIVLAFASLVIQTSRVSAIRATFDGDVVSSTVRRNPSQHHYLNHVGQQTYIIKLTGYLFFGTIVSVEEKIRGLLDDATFESRPIKFLVLDLWHVSDLDYSAGEAFNTISRLLDKRGVLLILSGVDASSQLGRNLRAVGIGSGKIEVVMLPDLNSALEFCENEFLKTLYARQEAINSNERVPTANLDVPTGTTSQLSSFDPPFNSPRQTHLVQAAHQALNTTETQRSPRWQSFNEPLRIMLQIFQGLSDKNEDFWFPATRFFQRREYMAGTTLFCRGEAATGFYLLERGILRAEYDLPQGWLCENIVAGTTCGELPFFSETSRTATVTVERDCVAWLMSREAWEQLQRERPDIAGELLRISLKLTTERMSSITSYILTTAG
ncbi:sulfate transporter [Cordyceps fumosorosea ARSEF 2679]|uniref:Sulfate transporter n=1 Tax=Cordyceps fumosorosea (strain ARSEF 2679) TaxID=1081104 RepID=A0A168E991_CORFA|nr:sulfate transporter [Cordyceps fumosorosea ARSEF 2679]OAA73530.1 sulfate transporter [Cordyceps fumosorosea ARSEF 2679]